MELTVECQKRAPGSKPNALRRSGKIPAVLYGHNGVESVELTLEAKAATVLVKQAAINNTLIQLNVTDMPWSGKTLLREVQSHPWKNSLYHLSFFSVGTHESIEVTVPLHFVGNAIGVKNSGGILDTVITELAVQCPPTKIPETIEVDVSNLDIGDSLSISDLQLPEGVVTLADGALIVVSVMRSSTSREAAAEETIPAS